MALVRRPELHKFSKATESKVETCFQNYNNVNGAARFKLLINTENKEG